LHQKKENFIMPKPSILFCILVIAGYANAQDLCTIATALLPSGVTCTGTGAAATLSASVTIPAGLSTTTTMTVSVAQKPCNPASASLTITDSRSAWITAGSSTVAVTNGVNTFPVPGASLTITGYGTISLQLEITLNGGINNAAGLTFSAALGVCVGTTCNSRLGILFSLFPLPIVPSFNIPNNLFTPAQLTTLCPPPPKPSSSDSLHASLALAGVAVAAVFV
jgi:hypothetical protein